jgi:hypothetical protein
MDSQRCWPELGFDEIAIDNIQAPFLDNEGLESGCRIPLARTNRKAAMALEVVKESQHRENHENRQFIPGRQTRSPRTP